MKTRVTITLDPEVHARAKALARARRTSVSAMVEQCLERAARRGARSGSLVDEMLGSAELRSPAPGSDRLFDALAAKYAARKR